MLMIPIGLTRYSVFNSVGALGDAVDKLIAITMTNKVSAINFLIIFTIPPEIQK
jgi:hypothetical protein